MSRTGSNTRRSGRVREQRQFVLVLAALVIAACGSPSGPGPVPDGPVIFSIMPNAGGIAGGTEVTISGLRFAAGATVTVGGRAATDVTVRDASTITAKTPEGAGAGATDVAVAVGGRSSVLPGGFTYQIPPDNVRPVIMSITARGSRANEPANFADVGETLNVSAAVRDEETPIEQLEYQWTASAGTVSGMGPSVTWQAPADGVPTPADVTLTLRVVERFGTGGIFQHEVTGTQRVSVHDSVRELGEMSRRFLTEFSRPQDNKDWRDIMRDFKAEACPDPGEFDAERAQVVNHYTKFFMNEFNVGPASVSFNFRGRCPFRNKPGDACIAVPVLWDSTDNSGSRPVRRRTSGTDYLAAAYSSVDLRWWLCSSDYDDETGTFSHSFYSR